MLLSGAPAPTQEWYDLLELTKMFLPRAAAQTGVRPDRRYMEGWSPSNKQSLCQSE